MRGWKTIETRTHPNFQTLVGQRIGIHAGKYIDSQESTVRNPFLRPDQIAFAPDEIDDGCGHLLGTAYVESFGRLNATHSRNALNDCDPEASGILRFGIFLIDIRPFAVPVRMNGKQGVWIAQYEHQSPLDLMNERERYA
jgi:hypothetical protein